MKRRSAEMRSVSDIICSSDNEYITIDVKSGDEIKYHSFVFGDKEFTINCAEYACKRIIRKFQQIILPQPIFIGGNYLGKLPRDIAERLHIKG